MADAIFRTTRVLLRNTVGTQDISIAGAFGGADPKGAIFTLTNAQTNNTIQSTIQFSQGYTDGTNKACSTIYSNNGSASGTADRRRTQSRISQLITGNIITVEVDFVQWLADGVRVNVIDPPSNEVFLTVTLIGGDGVTDVNVGEIDATATANVGFEPTILFANSVGLGNEFTAIHAIYSTGIALNTAGTPQYQSMVFDQDGVATTNTGRLLRNDSIVGQYFNGSLAWRSQVAFTATGWTNTITGATGGDVYSYLAIRLDGTQDLALNGFELPTSTGLATVGGTTFTPQYTHFISGFYIDLNLNNNSLLHTEFIVDTTNQYGNSIYSRDANANVECSTLSKVDGFRQIASASSTFYETTFDSFQSTGIRLDVTTTNATTPQAFALFLANQGQQNPTATGAFNLSAYIANGTVTATLPQPSATGVYNLSSFQFAGDVTADLPQPEITGQFNLSAFTIDGDATATLPQPTATGSFDLSAFTVSGDTTATLPQPESTGAFNLSALQFAGDVVATQQGFVIEGSFNLSALQFAGTVDATLPQPTSTGTFDLSVLQFSGEVEATEPVFDIDGAFNLSAFTISGDIDVTQPLPVITSAFTLPALQVSANITATGNIIIVSQGARLTPIVGSNLIIAEVGDNKLTLV